RVDGRFRPARDARSIVKHCLADLDDRSAGWMFRVRGDDEIEQNNPMLDQVRAQAQQSVERPNAIDKSLERAASHERCGIAKRQIERGYVLAKKLRAARDRIELRARACESRFGLVDAVHAESCLGQRNEQPSGTAHRIEL